MRITSPSTFLNTLISSLFRDYALERAFIFCIKICMNIDPACGCGNFLIITYRELRRLELAVLKMLIDNKNQMVIDISPYCKVNVNQFYGIEYEEFPCQIAQVGMWLMDHQMNALVAEHFGLYYARLPLKQTATIVHGNALRTDWESIVPKSELNYILGNPPFSGARIMNTEQKEDMGLVFGGTKGAGNLDYVTAWYRKAAEYIAHTKISAAFVSTNSISQGEQVAILWKPLLEKFGIIIYFGYRTFKWSNEAKGKAAVHCVIVGFSAYDKKRNKHIYESDGTVVESQNINPYLVNAKNIFIESRTNPICNVPKTGVGNQPIDGGNYLFSAKEKDAFIKIEPQAEKWFRPWIGSDEFINRYTRYCLWLEPCQPADLKNMPESLKRIDAVRRYRLESTRPVTRKLAETPRSFAFKNIPITPYIIIPEVSSERRAYIPMGFLPPSVLSSNLVKIIPNATLYHFGVLTSNIHMAWMRTVCGRLKSDYRYSANIVYNNFPWPNPTDAQKQAIEQAAQCVLDARALFPESSLADLYDPLTMPPELVKAHNTLDRAVKAAYGGKSYATEAERVADLMERYAALAGKQGK